MTGGQLQKGGGAKPFFAPPTDQSANQQRRLQPHGSASHSETGVCAGVCYVCSQVCCRHCAAVARRSGSISSMVSRKSLNCAAWSSGHSYFSSRTSNSPHGFRLEMCRSSPGQVRREKQPIREPIRNRWDLWAGLTSPGEVFPGIPARQGEGQRQRTQQLHDVGDVICREIAQLNTLRKYRTRTRLGTAALPSSLV